MKYNSKEKANIALQELVEDKEELIQYLCNYHSTKELNEIIEFIKDEKGIDKENDLDLVEDF